MGRSLENRFDFDHGYDIILIELGWPKGLWSTEWRWDPAPFFVLTEILFDAILKLPNG